MNLGYDDDVCDKIHEHKEHQVAVQQQVAVLQSYSGILQSVPAVLYALFAGPWSDVHGRKVLIVSSTFGNILNSGVYLLNILFFMELPAEFLLFEVNSAD